MTRKRRRKRRKERGGEEEEEKKGKIRQIQSNQQAGSYESKHQ